MSDKEFALECMKVQRLDFVDQVNVPANEPYVFVELNPMLRAVLPITLSVIQIRRSAFSVHEVIRRFDEDVVERLISATDLAQAQLRSARAQARKL